jgi:hypothetical protein
MWSVFDGMPSRQVSRSVGSNVRPLKCIANTDQWQVLQNELTRSCRRIMEVLINQRTRKTSVRCLGKSAKTLEGTT